MRPGLIHPGNPSATQAVRRQLISEASMRPGLIHPGNPVKRPKHSSIASRTRFNEARADSPGKSGPIACAGTPKIRDRPASMRPGLIHPGNRWQYRLQASNTAVASSFNEARADSPGKYRGSGFPNRPPLVLQ